MTTAEFVGLKEACYLLGCGPATVRRYRREGRIRWRWHVNGRRFEYVREDCARERVVVFRGDQSTPGP